LEKQVDDLEAGIEVAGEPGRSCVTLTDHLVQLCDDMRA
jgi:hypothetical protein